MWLLTPIGFFSIVQKPDDVTRNTLTVRARVRKDLESLRIRYLPGLGEIRESRSNDYRFRAQAPRSEISAAMTSLVDELSYANFKNQVRKEQGSARESVYHEVWCALHQLQE